MGMHRRSFYRWRDKDPEFDRACEEITEEILDEAEVLLQKKMRENDTTSLIFFLKTKGKNRGYVEKKELEHTGNSVFTTQINLIEKPVEAIKHERNKGNQSSDKPEAKGNAKSPGG